MSWSPCLWDIKKNIWRNNALLPSQYRSDMETKEKLNLGAPLVTDPNFTADMEYAKTVEPIKQLMVSSWGEHYERVSASYL